MDEADVDRVSRGSLYAISFTGAVTAEAGGCTVDSQTNIAMGTVSTSSFSGPDSRGPLVPFTVALLECKGNATSVFVQVEPTYGFADISSSVIALSKDEGTASGVGIQLLVNGEKIDPNAEGIKLLFNKGTTLIPFTASYYQVGESVRAGRADSTVVFYTYYE